MKSIQDGNSSLTLGILIVLASSVALGSGATNAGTSAKKMVSSKPVVRKVSDKYKDYGTSHAFNSANIKGKVQEGNMRRIVVENDKSLEDLLGIRKSFEDREREEGERN